MNTPENSAEQMLRKLVLELHLNNEERKILGRKQVLYSEVAEIISEAFEGQRAYPTYMKPWTGKPWGDAFCIERLETGSYRLHFQTSSQINWPQIGTQGQKDYADKDRVIHDYIANEFGHDIDGIQIIYG